MKPQTTSIDPSTQAMINPLPENLLRHPLDYLQADHLRLLKACDLLESILSDPESEVSHASAKVVLDHLKIDLPRHVADEEEGLFPRLISCCGPSDRIQDIIRILRDEHAYNSGLLESTVAGLLSLHEQSKTDALDPCCAVFAETERRHIRWEDALLLPLARNRLDPANLRALGLDMAMRRQVPYPERLIEPDQDAPQQQ